MEKTNRSRKFIDWIFCVEQQLYDENLFFKMKVENTFNSSRCLWKYKPYCVYGSIRNHLIFENILHLLYMSIFKVANLNDFFYLIEKKFGPDFMMILL